MANVTAPTTDFEKVPTLPKGELPDENFLHQVISTGIPAFMVHESVDVSELSASLQAYMGGGWQATPDLDIKYGSHSSEHVDGLNLSPYWLIHTTKSSGEGSPASKFIFRRYPPTRVQHNMLRVMSYSREGGANTNQHKFIMSIVIARMSIGLGGWMPELEPEATFMTIAPAGNHVVFINGYNASAQQPGDLFTHEVLSVDAITGEWVHRGRRIDANLLEPTSVQAKATNLLGQRSTVKH